MVLTISGLGAAFGLITLIMGYAIVAQGLPQHQVLRGITIISVASLLMVLLDLFLPTPRTTISGFLFYVVIGLSSVIVLIYLGLLARDFRNYDLRFKFISAVTALAMVSIVVTTIVVSVIVQSILTDEVGRSIHDVTASRASSMGEALAREVNLLQTISLNPIVRREMILQNVDYGNRPRNEIIRELETIDDNWRNTPSGTDDILFDEKLNSAAARELRAFQNQFLDNLELFITDRYGGLVAASQRPDRYYYGDDTWWRGAYKNGEGAIYISEPTYNAVLDTYEITIALPFYDRNDNNLLGIIHASYSLNELLSLLLLEADEVLGNGGHLDLVFQNLGLSPNETGTNYNPLPLNDSAQARTALSQTDEVYVLSTIEGNSSLVAESAIFTTSPYQVINDLEWIVLAHLPEAQALQSVAAQQRTQILLGVLILVGGIIAASVVGRIVARPIIELTDTAQRIAAGDLNARANIQTGDEIADLANAFNDMTNRLQRTQQNLESRVAERTHALELSAQISRSLSTIVERDELVLTVVRLLQEAFNYYHVHIYLVDESGENLVMVGGTGEAGQTLLAQKHSLKMGKGLVGRAAESNTAVLIRD
ncbi:MAG: HAMP domain-containing protein, partial [Anaerolineales bacterium]|nr:HAMP domain-containing protein [Anaerolineales bacterium]